LSNKKKRKKKKKKKRGECPPNIPHATTMERERRNRKRKRLKSKKYTAESKPPFP
jgi:hypothetical protein